jgi:hypothetical protein
MMARAMADLDFADGEVLAALGECAPLIAGALDTSSDPALETLVRSNLEQFAQCVRDQGVTEFPDPVRRFDGVGDPFPQSRVPWTDPDLPAAVIVCGDRMRSTSN